MTKKKPKHGDYGCPFCGKGPEQIYAEIFRASEYFIGQLACSNCGAHGPKAVFGLYAERDYMEHRLWIKWDELLIGQRNKLLKKVIL